VCCEEFGLGEEVLGGWCCVVQVGHVVVCGSIDGPFMVVDGCGWLWCVIGGRRWSVVDGGCGWTVVHGGLMYTNKNL